MVDCGVFKRDALDVHHFALAIVVGEGFAGDGNVDAGSAAGDPGGESLMSASTTTVSAMFAAGPPHSTLTGPVMEVSKPRSP